MTLADLLRRLRRHGVPGPARPAPVPADITAERIRELAPVFAALEASTEGAAATRAHAEADAQRVTELAASEALRVVRDAVGRAGTVAAAETARLLARVDEDNVRHLEDAQVEAEGVAAVAGEMIPSLSDRVAAAALAVAEEATEL